MRKWLIPSIIVILVLLIALLPKLASSSLGKPIFVRAFEEEIHGTVEIGALHLSWFGPQVFQRVTFTTPEVEGSVEELQKNVPLWSLKGIGGFLLKNGSFTFPGAGEGTIDQVNGQIKNGNFQLTGVTRQGGTSGNIAMQGKVFSKHRFDIQGEITSLPVAAIDRILNANNLLFQILGPNLNLKGSASLNKNQGAIDVQLASSHIHADIKANLSENGITLLEPINAAMQLTPSLSEVLMSEMNPLFLTGVESRNPIQLHIDSQDFFYPIPFSIEKLQGRGTLDMGQVVCTNGKSLATIISLLKLNPLSKIREMNVWFTPLSFQMDKGVLHTDRMDALIADSIHVCTWGYIDVAKDKLHINLGIPADTLSQTFMIKNLSDTYVLKVKIRGSTRDPDIDKGPAAAKIAAMIAASQIPKKGAVFGSLVNAFSQLKEDKDIPPAKRPFPWER